MSFRLWRIRLKAMFTEALTICGGDAIAALRITLIANAFLEAQIDELKEQISAGYARGRTRKPKHKPEGEHGEALMSVTYFVALPFVQAEDGLAPGRTAQSCRTSIPPSSRRRRFRAAGARGALAFKRTGDPNIGQFGEAQVLADVRQRAGNLDELSKSALLPSPQKVTTGGVRRELWISPCFAKGPAATPAFSLHGCQGGVSASGKTNGGDNVEIAFDRACDQPRNDFRPGLCAEVAGVLRAILQQALQRLGRRRSRGGKLHRSKCIPACYQARSKK